MPQNVRRAPQQESKEVIITKQEIERVFSLFEDMRYEEVIELCKKIHTNNIKECSVSDVKNIKDLLLEAGLEIALAGNNDVAISILKIVDSSPASDTPCMLGIGYHLEANTCKTILASGHGLLANSYVIGTHFENSISQKESLKCTPYFLAQVFQNGLFHVQQNDEKAKKYLKIATDRDYKPRNLITMKKQREEYKLMLTAQQNSGSVFFNVPREVISHITRLRIEATIAQSNRNKKTESNSGW